MRLVFISDTHGLHDDIEIPEGDVLIHCGDMSNLGTLVELSKFHSWFVSHEHEHKILIAGNHDLLFEHLPSFARELVSEGCHYLQDSSVVIGGVKFYGSPWTPTFGYGWAFNAEPLDITERWNVIPSDTDILITHGPAYGILDLTRDIHDGHYKHVGCPVLTNRIRNLPNLQVHAFGHIHDGYGVAVSDSIRFVGLRSVNASMTKIRDGRYLLDPLMVPICVDVR